MQVTEAIGVTQEVREAEAVVVDVVVAVAVVIMLVDRIVRVVHVIKQDTFSVSVQNASVNLVETKATMVGLRNVQNTND